MQLILNTDKVTPEQFAKRLLFLAYCASEVKGMGVLQAQDNVSEGQLWREYGGDEFNDPRASIAGVYIDYGFGRMMKIGVRPLRGTLQGVEVTSGSAPHHEWQSWSRFYGTYWALALATCHALCMLDAHYTITEE